MQRPFLYERPARRWRYSAFELSFACPEGLSGGPLFLAKDPTTVIGVVTAEFKSFTVPDEVEENTRRVITYGVAANIRNASDTIETILGRRLPEPERER